MDVTDRTGSKNYWQHGIETAVPEGGHWDTGEDYSIQKTIWILISKIKYSYLPSIPSKINHPTINPINENSTLPTQRKHQLGPNCGPTGKYKPLAFDRKRRQKAR